MCPGTNGAAEEGGAVVPSMLSLHSTRRAVTDSCPPLLPVLDSGGLSCFGVEFIKSQQYWNDRLMRKRKRDVVLSMLPDFS